MINVYLSKVLEGGTTVNTKESVGDYKDYYRLGGFELFDVVRVEWKGLEISLYVDDEGMMKPNNYGREVVGYPQPLFGNIIVTGGVDAEGETLGVPEELSIVDLMDYINDPSYITKGE